jgi:DsbC/DsbD-like thiol-disulfide interchange protein
MNRRHFLIAATACAAGILPAHATEQPWSARLLQGGFDGRVWWAGLAVSLEPKWKTYWRVPGDGGIAPLFEVTGENLKAHTVTYPLPQRHVDESGTVIGYKDEVVFPIALEPTDANRPLALQLRWLAGVCDVVCIPVQTTLTSSFDPAASAAPDQLLISRWRRTVPKAAESGPVTKAAVLVNEDGKLLLDLALQQAVRDVFVEAGPLHYFGTPNLTRGNARLPVNGAKSVQELSGQALRITIDTGNTPLEQSITLV